MSESIPNIVGGTNVGAHGTNSTTKLTIEHKGRLSGNQDSRNQVLAALDAGEVVGWFFTGAKGRPLPGFCVIAKDKQITFAGRFEDYSGETPTLRVSGTMGLGLLGGTFVGKNGVAKLPGSMTSTCFDAEKKQGVDADDFAQHLLIRAGF
jgi:hypothetical protein